MNELDKAYEKINKAEHELEEVRAKNIELGTALLNICCQEEIGCAPCSKCQEIINIAKATLNL
jgi:hypothetical protein